MKFRFPPEFEKLTPPQMNQVHAWLDEFAYRVVQENLLEAFGIRISLNKLCRYNQTREIADELGNDAAEIGAREIYQMYNAQPVPFEEATLHIIERRTFEHALRGDLTIAKLVALHKLATYKKRFAYDQRRLATSERRLGIKALPIQELTSPLNPSAPSSEMARPASTEPTTAVEHSDPAHAFSAPAPEPAEQTSSPQPNQGGARVLPSPFTVEPQPNLQPADPTPSVPSSLAPHDWSALIANAPAPSSPPAPTPGGKYAPPFSPTDRLLDSHIVRFPVSPDLNLTPQILAVPERSPTFTRILKSLPSELIPFPFPRAQPIPLAA